MQHLPALDSLGFSPRRSTHHARWCPIYLEPMVGSGERLCVGVVAQDATRTLVRAVTGLERLACVYGADELQPFLFATQVALATLEKKVTYEGIDSLQGWNGSVQGLVIGAARLGTGEDIEDIVHTGLMQCASLFHASEQAGVMRPEDENGFEEVTLRRLETLVKESVVSRRPDLKGYFGVQIRASENARPTRIGFVGRRLAANFALLVPGRLTTSVGHAKEKLWDLQLLRGSVNESLFPNLGGVQFELLLHRVSDQDPQYSARALKQVSAAVLALEEEADKANLRCRPLHSTSEIANLLLEREAA